MRKQRPGQVKKLKQSGTVRKPGSQDQNVAALLSEPKSSTGLVDAGYGLGDLWQVTGLCEP